MDDEDPMITVAADLAGVPAIESGIDGAGPALDLTGAATGPQPAFGGRPIEPEFVAFGRDLAVVTHANVGTAVGPGALPGPDAAAGPGAVAGPGTAIVAPIGTAAGLHTQLPTSPGLAIVFYAVFVSSGAWGSPRIRKDENVADFWRRRFLFHRYQGVVDNLKKLVGHPLGQALFLLHAAQDAMNVHLKWNEVTQSYEAPLLYLMPFMPLLLAGAHIQASVWCKDGTTPYPGGIAELGTADVFKLTEEETKKIKDEGVRQFVRKFVDVLRPHLHGKNSKPYEAMKAALRQALVIGANRWLALRVRFRSFVERGTEFLVRFTRLDIPGPTLRDLRGRVAQHRAPRDEGGAADYNVAQTRETAENVCARFRARPSVQRQQHLEDLYPGIARTAALKTVADAESDAANEEKGYMSPAKLQAVRQHAAEEIEAAGGGASANDEPTETGTNKRKQKNGQEGTRRTRGVRSATAASASSNACIDIAGSSTGAGASGHSAGHQTSSATASHGVAGALCGGPAIPECPPPPAGALSDDDSGAGIGPQVHRAPTWHGPGPVCASDVDHGQAPAVSSPPCALAPMSSEPNSKPTTYEGNGSTGVAAAPSRAAPAVEPRRTPSSPRPPTPRVGHVQALTQALMLIQSLALVGLAWPLVDSSSFGDTPWPLYAFDTAESIHDGQCFFYSVAAAVFAQAYGRRPSDALADVERLKSWAYLLRQKAMDQFEGMPIDNQIRALQLMYRPIDGPDWHTLSQAFQNAVQAGNWRVAVERYDEERPTAFPPEWQLDAKIWGLQLKYGRIEGDDANWDDMSQDFRTAVLTRNWRRAVTLYIADMRGMTEAEFLAGAVKNSWPYATNLEVELLAAALQRNIALWQCTDYRMQDGCDMRLTGVFGTGTVPNAAGAAANLNVVYLGFVDCMDKEGSRTAQAGAKHYEPVHLKRHRLPVA